MSKILVSWSIAYDSIMQFDGEFADLIIPDQIKNLNVCFNLSKLEKLNGGTWHNISYSLGLLGCRDQTIFFAWVGRDFIEEEQLSSLIDYSHIFKDQSLYTANCSIITEKKHNQIITFYPWALTKAQELSINDLSQKHDISYAMLSPNWKASVKFVNECNQNNIKSFFDPGQEIGIFSKDELQLILQNVNYLIVNDYEYQLIKERSWFDDSKLLEHLDKIIVTLGKDWVSIIDKDWKIIIPALNVSNVVDPTWCGDAFRAWLLYGLINHKSREEAAKIWNVVASFVVQSQWGMNHFFTLDQILQLYKETYNT